MSRKNRNARSVIHTQRKFNRNLISQSLQGHMTMNEVPIPATGNTNTHGYFGPDVCAFLRRWSLEGPTHHFALGIGHHAAELRKLGRALGIETVVVTETAP